MTHTASIAPNTRVVCGIPLITVPLRWLETDMGFALPPPPLISGAMIKSERKWENRGNWNDIEQLCRYINTAQHSVISKQNRKRFSPCRIAKERLIFHPFNCLVYANPDLLQSNSLHKIFRDVDWREVRFESQPSSSSLLSVPPIFVSPSLSRKRGIIIRNIFGTAKTYIFSLCCFYVHVCFNVCSIHPWLFGATILSKYNYNSVPPSKFQPNLQPI